VMEYVEGSSIRGLLGEIGSQRALPAEEALRIGIQVCSGLHSLHNAGITDKSGERVFHRDIKPENLLVRKSDGLVKISDFGISTVLEASGLASTQTGTLPYMSPELLEGDGADHRADVYGVGVTLYEMVTGRLPFDPFNGTRRPKGPMMYGREICRGNPPAPTAVADVDTDLSRMILKAMHHDVRQRCQSAQELGDALEDLQARLSVDSAIAAAWKEPDSAARERCLREIVNRFPRSPNGHRNLAWFLNGQLRVPEALAALEEGRVQCRDCGELLVDLALAYERVGKARQAIDTLEEARRKGLPPDVEQRTKALLTAWRRRL